MSQIPTGSPLTGFARRFVLGITSVGGLGYAPFAPGTFGSLGAMPFWWLAAVLSPIHYVFLTLGVIGLSIWASNHAEVIYGEHDSGKIVVDEFAGISNWILNSSDLAVGYRSLCCLSPLRHLEATSYSTDRSFLGGGAGVVLDDVVAGIMACITLHLAKVVIG